MRVLIVGAGVGGLTLAAFLESSHVEYDIIDKSRTVEQPGFFLVAWDNGRDILRKLGLADKFDAIGTRIQNYSVRDGKGNLLRNYNLKDFYVNYGTAITMVSRENLREWLLSKIDPSKIKTCVAIEKITQNELSVNVVLSNKETRNYDVVIGADGVHSTVRALEFQKDVERYENWRCWWLWVSNKFNAPATITEYIEPGENILVFSAGARSLAILAAPADHKGWDTPAGRINKLKEIFKDETAVVPEAFNNLKDEDVMPSDLLKAEVKNWVKGRVALLGDAAHSFGPHAGLGASMAMEDAYVLAGELIRVSNQYPLEKALRNYQKMRKHRVAIAKTLNEAMRLWTLIKSPVLRKIVNICVQFVPERFLVGAFNKLLKEEI